MGKDRTTRLLEEFTAVTDAAPRPDSRRMTMRSRFPMATLSAASLIVVVVAVAAIVLGRPAVGPTAGASPAASPVTPSPTATPLASAPVVVPSLPAATPTPSIASPVPADGPTPAPTIATCDLAARIVSWEGAAGQRIATVDLVNRGTSACLLDTAPRPQFVDGAGKVLIDGTAGSAGVLTLAAGAHASTLVEVGNWCKPDPQAPVSVAFVFRDGRRLVADPVSPTDRTLPPCNGPSQPATIAMHPWSAG